MRKIMRMMVFSFVALYLTSFWNKGFILPQEVTAVIEIVFAVALSYYLIIPISKVILLPLNILTLGLVSSALYVFLLYILSNHLGLFEIKPWSFQGIQISYMTNLIVSSISISAIIKLLERIL